MASVSTGSPSQAGWEWCGRAVRENHRAGEAGKASQAQAPSQLSPHISPFNDSHLPLLSTSTPVLLCPLPGTMSPDNSALSRWLLEVSQPPVHTWCCMVSRLLGARVPYLRGAQALVLSHQPPQAHCVPRGHHYPPSPLLVTLKDTWKRQEKTDRECGDLK